MKRVIISRDINWAEGKVTDSAETMKIFRTMDKKDLVPGIYKLIVQDNNLTSKPKYLLPVQVIPY